MTLLAPTSTLPRGLLAYVGICIIWGTTYLAIALSIRTLPPFTSGALRFFFAAALMYVWLRARTARPFAEIDLKRAVICGALLTGFGNGLVIWAEQGVPSGIAALVVASIPVFVLGVECLFFAGRLPTPQAAFGMLLAIAGVVVIVAHAGKLSGAARPIYVVALVLAVLSWSFGTLLQREARLQSPQILAFTCVQLFSGAVLQTALALLNGEWRALTTLQASLTSTMAVAYLVVFGSIVGLSCYTWLLTQWAPQKVATYALVNPVVALLLGAWILSERITAVTLWAAMCVLVGIALVLFPKLDIGLPRGWSPGEAA